MTTVLLTGQGRYSDPWHPFEETTAALAALLSDRGHEVEARGDVEEALSDLAMGRMATPDMLVVNIGLPRDSGPSPTLAGRAALLHLSRSEVPLLGIHVSATSFIDSPEWPALLGGRWVRGVTMHPEFGPARIAITDALHPVTEGLTDFDVEDERYSWLEVSPAARILATHQYEGTQHPIAWALEREGGGRTVYDALGHSAVSYDSVGHRALLERALDWLRR